MINYAYSSYSKTGYTQSDEEAHILKYLGDSGRFLDVGAYDGITFSNTRALLERGWHGVYVEPCPSAIAKLRKNTLPYAQQIQIVQAAVAETEGKASFHPCDEMVGTLLMPDKERWKRYVTFKDPIDVQTITPQSLLESVGFEFDMISIDTEGMNKTIFSLMPWSRLNPSLIVVEHDSNKQVPQNMIDRLPKYHVVYANRENVIFVRNDA